MTSAAEQRFQTHDPVSARSRAPICYGHRGARGHAPENTLLAFDLAFDLGAEGIECDVQLSRDRRLVVIHDGTVNRTTNGRGAVSALTLAEMQALDAGRGQRIPTLEATLALIRARSGRINIEVKAEGDDEAVAVAEAVATLLGALPEEDALRQAILVSSFNHPALPVIKQRLPWVATGALFGGRAWTRRTMIERAQSLGADAIHPHPRILSPEVVRAAHEAGLRVNVWTANLWPTIRQLVALEVDGVFTDFPERVVITRRLGVEPEA